MQKMEGDNIYLYKVLDQECISRETAKELWKSGKVTGLFNLPSEELFAACKDFGIKVEPSELKKSEEESKALRYKFRMLIERGLEKDKEIFNLKTQLSELAKDFLLQEEEYKKKTKDLQSRCNSAKKDKKKFSKTNAENERLREELKHLRTELENIKLKEQRNAQKANEALSRLREEAKQDREHLKQLASENKELAASVRKLTLENEELKVSSHLTQTDHLNKQLLLSFMNNMDSLNYRWQDEQNDDEWDEEDSCNPNNNNDDDRDTTNSKDP